MRSRDRLIQVVLVLLAGGLLAVAAALQGPIRSAGQANEFITPETEAALQANPELSMLTSLPGGLRVLAVNYLWIRSQQAHNAGRHYDAYQLAELITQLQPYQPGVWAFQAWNMAWNISVKTNTPEERWRWVYAGVELLRDRGIPLNPRSLALYKELSWIFFSKIGDTLDEAHWTYKARWAGMMQRVLGSPPHEDTLAETLAEQTARAIDAFRPIAEAPLDKDPRRQGREPFQDDQRAVLLQDPAVADLAGKLAPLGVKLDDSLLVAFNAWSLDPSVAIVRNAPPQPANDAERALRDLLNDLAHAEPLAKALAWVRAQTLWNQYRLDPGFMLELMTRYEVPLDWRHAVAHGLYWASYGEKMNPPENPKEMTALNNSRNVLNSLKKLTATGLVNLDQRPDAPLYPAYFESADLRYIEPTHQQHIRLAEQVIEISGKPFEKNTFAGGHANYLKEAINMLTADGRIAAAQRYLDWIREKYKKTGRDWDFDNVEDFVIHHLGKDSTIRYVIVLELMQFTLKRAMIARGIADNPEEYQQRMAFAVRLHNFYQKDATTRLKLLPMRDMTAMMLSNLMIRPRVFGVALTIEQRSDIYLAMQDQPEILVRVYHRIEPVLRRLCKENDLNFEAAFPPPPGLDAFRQQLKQRMTGPQQREKID